MATRKKPKVHHEGVNLTNTKPAETDYEHVAEKQDLRELLEPFSKEQLIHIIKNVVSNTPQILKQHLLSDNFLATFTKQHLIQILHNVSSKNNSNVLDEIHRVVDLHFDHHKLFVYGFNKETTSNKLKVFFSKYGEIDHCHAVHDNVTGKTKGYGFVSFKDRDGARKALEERNKANGTRLVAYHLASTSAGARSFSSRSNDVLQRKVFVGHVDPSVPAEKLLAYFEQYGEIEEGPWGFDISTGKSMGYAIFVYKTAEGAARASQVPFKWFMGKQVFCIRSIHAKNNNNSSHYQMPKPAASQPTSESGFDQFNGMGGFGVGGGFYGIDSYGGGYHHEFGTFGGGYYGMACGTSDGVYYGLGGTSIGGYGYYGDGGSYGGDVRYGFGTVGVGVGVGVGGGGDAKCGIANVGGDGTTTGVGIGGGGGDEKCGIGPIGNVGGEGTTIGGATGGGIGGGGDGTGGVEDGGGGNEGLKQGFNGLSWFFWIHLCFVMFLLFVFTSIV